MPHHLSHTGGGPCRRMQLIGRKQAASMRPADDILTGLAARPFISRRMPQPLDADGDSFSLTPGLSGPRQPVRRVEAPHSGGTLRGQTSDLRWGSFDESDSDSSV